MKKLIGIICSSFVSFMVFCQEPISFSYNGGKNYTMVERTDLRRYDNNKYKGLVSREVKACIAGKDGLYEGSFYVDEKTLHKAVSVAPSINSAVPSTFRINENGSFEMLEDCGYPSFRSFPAFPKNPVKIGDTWTAKAERSVDPLNKNKPTIIPMEVLYTFMGEEVFHNEEVYVLSAEWATRYGNGIIDVNGDSELRSATGKHKATMYISKETGYAVVIRDYGEDNFFYTDGNVYSFKGSINLFTEYAPSMNAEKVMPVINRIGVTLGDSVGVEETAAGLCLTMKNLQFMPDSAKLLPGEEERLNEIAQLLIVSNAPAFLIEGHTANTGVSDGEMELSIERARTIAQELVKRGVPAEKCICQGRGSSRPVADNSTPEGRAANRRVTITLFSK